MSYTNSGSGLPNYWPDGKFQQMAKIHKLLLEGMKLIVIEGLHACLGGFYFLGCFEYWQFNEINLLEFCLKH
jgi:hypothetical protein